MSTWDETLESIQRSDRASRTIGYAQARIDLVEILKDISRVDADLMREINTALKISNKIRYPENK